MTALPIWRHIRSDPYGAAGHRPSHNLKTMISPDARGLAWDGTWHLAVQDVGWMLDWRVQIRGQGRGPPTHFGDETGHAS